MKRLKLVVLGAQGVGRTCLLESYVMGGLVNSGRNGSGNRPRSFMQCDTSNYCINIVVDGAPYSLKLFDPDHEISDEELAHLLTTEQPDAIILMYDISQFPSFENIEPRYRQVRSILPKIKCVLAGNKLDLRIRNPTHLPLVTEAEGKALAERLRLRAFIETSGIALRHVDQLIDQTVRIAAPALSELNFRFKRNRHKDCSIM